MKLFRACRKRRATPQPGEILDQVISQSTSSAASQCLLYRLANYKRGGALIDAYTTGGAVAAERVIRNEYAPYMYNAGKGQPINRAEYLRWKYMDNAEVTIPIEAALSAHDPLGRWTDHSACWQMQYRGRLGESLLHVLIVCDTRVHTKLARLLLRCWPRLALDVMEGEEYLGASALHLAIAYSNNELVKDLIEAGADVAQRATGSFFLPRDQQRRRPARATDYEGLAYMGELPLAWAACCANESVYNLLMDHDADPDAADRFGNTILHMVVVCDKLDMFGYALRHPRRPARNGLLNRAGLTPLTLACQLGRAEVFREMLELSSKEFWRYSNITCSGYPLNALDTLLPDGRTNWNSALFIILNGTKEEHLDMLDGGIIQRLLEEKWKTFAQNQFLKRLLILFVHLFFLSLSVYLRPATENMATRAELDARQLETSTARGGDDDGGGGGGVVATPTDANNVTETPPSDEGVYDTQNIIRYGCEVATLVGVLSYIIFQQGDEIRNQGGAAYLKQLANAPAKAIFLLSNFLLLLCIPFRMRGDTDTEEAILLFAVPASWFLLMFFAGAIRLTGPFVTMIFSMITGDMFTFGIIYSIVLFGFSQAFFFLYKGHPQVEQTLFHTYPSTWMALFQTTLGDYNYADLNNTTYPNLAKTVFVIFMIFVPILLLNMLIAMMGNTYAHVIEQSEKEWMKQWAKIVVTLERAVSQADAQKYLQAYSIPLSSAAENADGYETRGVLVIKSKSKSRAKQRRGAVSNWKRVGRVTVAALKKREMTGEQLRRIMWGRASISSPAKVSKKRAHLVGAAGGGAAGVQNLYGAQPPQQQQQPLAAMPMTSTATSAAAINAPTINAALGGMSFASDIVIPSAAPPVDYNDPLRELVLISDAVAAGSDASRKQQMLSSATTLAKAATTLDHVHEVLPPSADQQTHLDQLQRGEIVMPMMPAAAVASSTSPAVQPATTTSTSIPPSAAAPPAPAAAGGAGLQLFQDDKDRIDPVKEREFMRRLEAALADSDGTDEQPPVLGKISHLRRARSALVARCAAEEAAAANGDETDGLMRRANERHPLFHVAWRAAEEAPDPMMGASLRSSSKHRRQHGRQNAAATAGGGGGGQANAAFVLDIETDASAAMANDADDDDDADMPTREEVRQHMEQFHMRRCPKPHKDGRVMDERTGKLVRHRRARTARNKVSPTEDDDDDERTTPSRPLRKGARARTATARSVDQDPLQPWCTRDLVSMKELMADSTD